MVQKKNKTSRRIAIACQGGGSHTAFVRSDAGKSGKPYLPVSPKSEPFHSPIRRYWQHCETVAQSLLPAAPGKATSADSGHDAGVF